MGAVVRDFTEEFSSDEIVASLLDYAIHDLKSGSGYYAETGWKVLLEKSEGSNFTLAGFGRINVLKNSYNYEDYDSTDQGGEDFSIVLQIDGDSRFWKKDGHYDSYGGVEWKSKLQTTTGKLKTITVFE